MIPDLIKPDRAAAAAGIQLKHWAGTHTRDADAVCVNSSFGGGKKETFHKISLNKA